MKARKSLLAERLLADPAARDKFRLFMASRKVVSGGVGEANRLGEAIPVATGEGQVLVVPRLLSTKVAG